MQNNGLNQDLALVLSIFVSKRYLNQFTAMNQNIKLWVSLPENALNLLKEL